VDDPVASLDINLDDLWSVHVAISLALLEDTAFPAHGAAFLSVCHLDGFLASRFGAVDSFVFHRVEG